MSLARQNTTYGMYVICLSAPLRGRGKDILHESVALGFMTSQKCCCNGKGVMFCAVAHLAIENVWNWTNAEESRNRKGDCFYCNEICRICVLSGPIGIMGYGFPGCGQLSSQTNGESSLQLNGPCRWGS